MPTTMIQKLKNYEMLLKWKFGVEKKMLLPKNMKVLHAGAGARGRPPHAGAPAADSKPRIIFNAKPTMFF